MDLKGKIFEVGAWLGSPRSQHQFPRPQLPQLCWIHSEDSFHPPALEHTLEDNRASWPNRGFGHLVLEAYKVHA